MTYPGSGMADGARGDIISLYPPLIVTEADIAEIAERVEAALTEVERNLRV